MRQKSALISTLAIFFILLFASAAVSATTTQTFEIKLAQNLNASKLGFKFVQDLYPEQMILWYPQTNGSAIILVPNNAPPNSTTGALMLIYYQFPNGTSEVVPIVTDVKVAGETQLAFTLNLGNQGTTVGTAYGWSNIQFINPPLANGKVQLPLLNPNLTTVDGIIKTPLPILGGSLPQPGGTITGSLYNNIQITNPIGSFNGGSSINIVNSTHGAVAINGGNGVVIQNTEDGTIYYSSGNTYESINYTSISNTNENLNYYSYSYSTYSSYAPTNVYEPTNINESSVQYIIPSSTSSGSGLSGSMLFWAAIGAGVLIIFIIIIMAFTGKKQKQ